MLVTDLGSQHDLMLAVRGFQFNSLSVVLGPLENRLLCSARRGAARMIVGALVFGQASRLDEVKLESIYRRPKVISIRLGMPWSYGNNPGVTGSCACRRCRRGTLGTSPTRTTTASIP